MRVILCESADAGHATQLTRLLPAVDRSELREAHGHLPVAALLAGKNLDVHRAVHRLEQVAVDLALLHQVRELRAAALLLRELVDHLPIDERRELALAVVRIVPAGFVQTEAPDVRREDLLVPLPPQMLGNEVLELLSDDRAVRF